MANEKIPRNAYRRGDHTACLTRTIAVPSEDLADADYLPLSNVRDIDIISTSTSSLTWFNLSGPNILCAWIDQNCEALVRRQAP